MTPAIAWLAVAGYIAFAIYLRRKGCDEYEEEEPQYFDTSGLKAEVEALARAMQELEALDSLLIDLRMCKPEEAMRAFRMQWQSVSGKNFAFDFFADGRNATTQHMLGLVQDERDALNQEIIQRVYDLYNVAVIAAGNAEEE